MPIDLPPEIPCQMVRQEDGKKYKIIIRCEDRADIVLVEVDPDYKLPAFIPLLTK